MQKSRKILFKTLTSKKVIKSNSRFANASEDDICKKLEEAGLVRILKAKLQPYQIIIPFDTENK